MRWAKYIVKVGRALTPFEARDLGSVPGVLLLDGGAKILVPWNAGWIIGQRLSVFGIPHAVIPIGDRPPDADLILEAVPDIRPEHLGSFTPYQREGFRRAMTWGALLAKWPAGSGKTWLGVALCAAAQGHSLVVTSMPAKEQWLAEFERLTTIPREQILVLYGLSPFEVEERKTPPPEQFWLHKGPQLVVDWWRLALGDWERGARAAGTWPGVGAKVQAELAASGLQGFIEDQQKRRADHAEKLARAKERLETAQERLEAARKPEALTKAEAALAKARERLERVQAEGPPVRAVDGVLDVLMALGRMDPSAPLLESAQRLLQVTRLSGDLGAVHAFLASFNGAPLHKVGEYLQWFDRQPTFPWQVRHGVTGEAVMFWSTEQEARSDVQRRTSGGPMNLAATLLAPYRVVVTNWDILAAWAPVLAAWGPHTVILDEVHRGKSSKDRWIADAPAVDPITGIVDTKHKPKFRPGDNQSAAAMVVSKPAARVVGLSATPMADGKPRDLWAQLDDLLPKQFGRYRQYTERYSSGFQGAYGWDDSGESNTQELRARLSFVMHEVSKAETHAGLPPMRLLPLKVPASELAQVRTSRRERAEAVSRGPSAVREMLLANAAAMKNPWLAARAVDALGNGQKVVLFQGRIDACAELGELVARGAKKLKGVTPQVFVVHGEESGKPSLRREIMTQFIRSSEPVALVCMLQAWGESLDGLQYAHRAIFAMLPSTVRQAIQGIGRFDRKPSAAGLDARQELPSTIVEWPVALGTIDEAIHDTVLCKLDVTGKVIGDTDADATALALRGGRTDAMILDEMTTKALADADRWAKFEDDDD